MVTISIEYKGDLRCVARHDPSGVELVTDAPVDNQGKGESFSPTDLLGAAFGTCMLTIMGIQAQALKVNIRGTRVKVTKEMTKESPRRTARLTVEFWIPCEPEEKVRERLIRAAESCPLHHSLHPDVEKVSRYYWGVASEGAIDKPGS